MLGTYERLGVHAMASNREVVEAAHAKLSDAGKAPENWPKRFQFYRIMIRHHRDARSLYLDVQSGRI